MGKVSARSPVFGRDAELALIRTVVEDTTAGQPRLLLVAGEAGSGKTALVQSALGGSAAALTLHWGDASEFGSSEFGPIKDLLRRLQRQCAERYEALRREHAALAALLPDNGPCQLSFDRESLFDAVTDALLTLGHEAPAALVFDDLHAADHASIELLARLSQRLDEQRVLLYVKTQGRSGCPQIRRPSCRAIPSRASFPWSIQVPMCIPPRC